MTALNAASISGLESAFAPKTVDHCAGSRGQSSVTGLASFPSVWNTVSHHQRSILDQPILKQNESFAIFLDPHGSGPPPGQFEYDGACLLGTLSLHRNDAARHKTTSRIPHNQLGIPRYGFWSCLRIASSQLLE